MSDDQSEIYMLKQQIQDLKNEIQSLKFSKKVEKVHLDLMRNCLGLLYKKVPYRNYFMAPKNTETSNNWDFLCSLGYACKSEGASDKEHNYYYCTVSGARLLGVSDQEFDKIH